MVFSQRHSRQEAGKYAQDYISQREIMLGRLHHFSNVFSKNSNLHASEAPKIVDSSLEDEDLAVHALRHIILIRLHRSMAYRHMSSELIFRNIKEAKKAAEDMLKILQMSQEPALQTPTSQYLPSPLMGHDPHSFTVPASSIPFVTHAALLVVDILTAAGSLSRTAFQDLLARSQSLFVVIDQFSHSWASVRMTRDLIHRRLEALRAIGKASQESKSTEVVWKFCHPLDRTSKRREDIIYPDCDRNDMTVFRHMRIEPNRVSLSIQD